MYKCKQGHAVDISICSDVTRMLVAFHTHKLCHFTRNAYQPTTASQSCTLCHVTFSHAARLQLKTVQCDTIQSYQLRGKPVPMQVSTCHPACRPTLRDPPTSQQCSGSYRQYWIFHGLFWQSSCLCTMLPVLQQSGTPTSAVHGSAATSTRTGASAASNSAHCFTTCHSCAAVSRRRRQSAVKRHAIMQAAHAHVLNVLAKVSQGMSPPRCDMLE